MGTSFLVVEGAFRDFSLPRPGGRSRTASLIF
jgi:hypothetical protein